MKQEVKEQKIKAVIQGAIFLVLGILIAVFGIGSTMDIYLGVLAIISGTGLICFSCYLFLMKQPMALAPLGLGAALFGIAIGVFVKEITFQMLITILLFALLGFSCALMLFGIYTAVKFNPLFGISQIIIGAGLFVLAMCYHFIPDFRNVFWIIAGILIAVYGGLYAIYALVRKD